ncbi:MAG: hypothetical protein EBU90_13935 [Proteobacteria bacterium]|nr:hypothetical protein [Pseudomonadota bacterium]
MKNIYEIFDEFEEAKTKEERKAVIERNLSPTLYKVLEYAFHPNYEWTIEEIPDSYKIPDTFPGVSYAHLGTELRRIYLFQKGHPTEQNLTEQRKTELLIQLLESLEPREAEVIMGIMKKDLGVKGLTYKFVKECFPNMLP